MEKPTKLNRKERKALEENERILKAREKERIAKRKRLTGFGLAGGAVILAATAGLALIGNQKNSDPIPPPTKSGDLYGKEAWKTVQREIIRLGIEGSGREAALWDEAQGFYPEVLPTDPEERIKAVQEIVVQTIAAMGRSENPYFKKANAIIGSQISNNNLIFDTESIGEPYASLRVVNNEGKVTWALTYNTDRILQDRSSSYLAMIITHEASHIEQAVKFRNQHHDMPTDEFIEFYQSTSDKISFAIMEESLAYAEGANAFIYSAGLMTSAVTEDFTPMVDAANLIRCKRNVTSECWQGYIASDSRRLSLE